MASGTERWLILPELGEERGVPDISVLRRGTDRTAHGREEERCAMVVGGGGGEEEDETGGRCLRGMVWVSR